MSAWVVTVSLLLGAEPSDAQLVAEAERAFAEGLSQRDQGERGAEAFRQAAQWFEQLRRRGYDNPALARNLGNAYFLAGDLPHAILTYRQGLRLAPEDRKLRDCLEFAREQVVRAEPHLGRPGDDIVPPVGTRWLLLGLTGLYVLGWLLLTRAGMLRWRVGLGIGGLFIVAALVGVYLAQPAPSRPVAVLARDGVLLRKGNSEFFPPWFETPLNRGMEATILYRREDWVQVELASGEIGWVRQRDLVSEAPDRLQTADRAGHDWARPWR